MKRVSPALAGGARVRHHGQAMTVATPETDSRIWIPPINKTVATEGKGIEEVAASIARHAGHLRQNGDWQRRDRARLESELELLLREELMDRFLERIPQEAYDELIENVVNRNISPYEAVRSLLNSK
jgi:LAO/AO transport system kinase